MAQQRHPQISRPVRELGKSFMRTAVGRALTKGFRKVPRSSFLLFVSFALGTLVAAHRGSFSKPLVDAFSMFTSDVHDGNAMFALNSGSLTLSIALAGMCISLLGTYCALGWIYALNPTFSGRRIMKRTLRASLYACAGSILSVLLLNITQVGVHAQIARQIETNHALMEILHLRQSPLKRLAADFKAGRWWVTDGDGPAARDIKKIAHDGGTRERKMIMTTLDLRINSKREPNNGLD